MADFDDLTLDKSAAPPPPSQPRWIPIVAGLALLVALIAVWYYLSRDDVPDRPAAATTEGTVPQTPQQATEEPIVDLPPLDASDAFVRDLVRALSQHPVVTAFLTTDGLIRTFAVSVVNVADGDTPSRHLYTIKPQQPFATQSAANRTTIDPRSYERYDGHAAAVASIDPAGAAQLYERLEPRIQEAYREIAGPDADFRRALERAIAELLRAPIVEGPIAVERQVVGYDYADPRLASLSRAQQQLVRMGPGNARTVQRQLRQIAAHLGIDETSLPQERVISTTGR